MMRVGRGRSRERGRIKKRRRKAEEQEDIKKEEEKKERWKGVCYCDSQFDIEFVYAKIERVD